MKSFISIAIVTIASLMQHAAVQAVPNAPSTLHSRATANYHDVATVGYAALGKTTGGSGGPVVTVTTLADLQKYVNDDVARVIIIQGTITGAARVEVRSNKTILGADSNAALVGIGFAVSGYQNIIIRNIKISLVKKENGDAFGARDATRLWLDHLEVSSDTTSDDVYDGLIDITHATTYVTVSNVYFHDHIKTSLISAADTETADTVITATYVGNYWKTLDARCPSIRFGKAHIFNNYYLNVRSAVNTRMGAQVLVEGNVFEGVTGALVSASSVSVGYAVQRNNDFGGAANTAPLGTFTTAPYSYTLLATSSVKASVIANAGAKLTWSTTATTTTKASSTTTKTSTAATSTGSLGAAYSQCGGSGWTGPTACVSGWTCVYSNEFYSQCVQV